MSKKNVKMNKQRESVGFDSACGTNAKVDVSPTLTTGGNGRVAIINIKPKSLLYKKGQDAVIEGYKAERSNKL